MSTQAIEGTVLAVTAVWRVPPDVLLEAPYIVAIVQPDEGRELLAIGEGEDAPALGERVTVAPDVVSRDGESADLLRLCRLVGERGGVS